MELQLDFIADYLNDQGFECVVFSEKVVSLSSARMLRMERFAARPDYLYVCDPNKFAGTVNPEVPYLLSGKDDIRFKEASRIIALNAEGSSLLYDLVLDLFSFLSQWRGILRNVVTSGNPIQELLEKSCQAFDHSALSVVASDLQVLGYIQNSTAGNSLKARNMWEDRIYMDREKISPIRVEMAANLRKGPYFEMDTTYGASVRVLRNNVMTHSGQLICRITVAEGTRPLREYHKFLLSILSQYVSEIIQRDTSMLQQTGRIGSVFLTNLLLGKEQAEFTLKHISQNLYLNLDGKYLVFCFSSPSGSEESQRSTYFYLSRLFYNWARNSKVVYISGLTVVVCPDKIDIGEREIAQRINNSVNISGLHCGISNFVEGLASLAVSYQQALCAHDRSIVEKRAIAYSDSLFHHVIKEFGKQNFCEAYLHPAIKKLAEYDAAHNSNLVETMYIYLSSDRSYNYCIEKLAIHKSTLRYRINMINDILDVDYADIDTKLSLLVSAKLYLDFFTKPGKRY